MLRKQITLKDLNKIHEALYEIPKTFQSNMKVPAWVFVNKELLEEIMSDASLQQIANVATLPGIIKHSLAMPDIHQGYGFPIGGVAAFDIDQGGIISPGGIGYDINCGVRLLVANINSKDIQKYLEDLATSNR